MQSCEDDDLLEMIESIERGLSDLKRMLLELRNKKVETEG